jgi:hypothetical protein
MSSYAERVGELRPLASRAEVARLYDDERPPYPEAPWRGFTAHYGPKVGDAPDGAAAPDTLEYMVLDASFPPTVDFYGLSIDMPFEAARESIAQLGLAPRPLREGLPANVRSFAGLTPDSFEISLLFKGNLAEIRLYRPDYWRLFETRQSFMKARAEAETKHRARMNAWKAITDDDDAMLMDWAKYCQPWSESTPSEFVKFAEWLLKADPNQRHAATYWCNWGYGLAPLLWISRRPDCDIATAVHILFGCDPAYYLKFAGDRIRVERESSGIEAYDMMMEIKGRIERGFYQRSEILFDTRDEMEILDRYNPTPALLSTVLPNNLRSRYEGVRIDRANNFGGLRHPGFLID